MMQTTIPCEEEREAYEKLELEPVFGAIDGLKQGLMVGAMKFIAMEKRVAELEAVCREALDARGKDEVRLVQAMRKMRELLEK